jgi:lipopolysaccharide/colanic/teichoic acid biosynthesis glycosyltransferase
MQRVIPSGDAAMRLQTTGPATSRAKRSIDVLFSSVAVLALAPVLLIVAAIIVLDSGWPPLFVQRRIGLHGRPFRMWKFRTMVVNAESLRATLEDRNEAPFPAFKVSSDPRVTRIGRLLRRSSVDELPQLVNVISGDMSLVGPRPPLPEEVDHYTTAMWARLSVRPGLTCTWQLSHRHVGTRLTFDEWVDLDTEYIANWSLLRDLQIIVRTLAVVLRMSGT